MAFIRHTDGSQEPNGVGAPSRPLCASDSVSLPRIHAALMHFFNSAGRCSLDGTAGELSRAKLLAEAVAFEEGRRQLVTGVANCVLPLRRTRSRGVRVAVRFTSCCMPVLCCALVRFP